MERHVASRNIPKHTHRSSNRCAANQTRRNRNVRALFPDLQGICLKEGCESICVRNKEYRVTPTHTNLQTCNLSHVAMSDKKCRCKENFIPCRIGRVQGKNCLTMPRLCDILFSVLGVAGGMGVLPQPASKRDVLLGFESLSVEMKTPSAFRRSWVT